MPRDASSTPTVSRLASRAQGLRRKEMPGGGEVFTGDLASRSLKALGARAMTVDHSIIVADDFDPSSPEDQALFAHEQYHLQNSGGEGANQGYDGEELAARSVERMVLHRLQTGGTESHEAGHTMAPAGAPTGAAGAGHEKGRDGEKRDGWRRGYQALRGQGLSHEAIVDRLAREALLGLEASKEARNHRGGDKKGWI
jgi:hypothetical protein